MKKYVYLIAFIFILVSCNKRQKVVEETYEGGSPKVEKYYEGEGANKELVKEVTYYPNKQKQLEGDYKDSKRDGNWVYYYDNGNKWSEGTFHNGLYDGNSTTYFENGAKRYDGLYKAGKKIGIWKFYDETSGKQIREVDFDKSDTTGIKY